MNEIAEEQKKCSQKLDNIMNDIQIIKESCENVRPEFLNVKTHLFSMKSA